MIVLGIDPGTAAVGFGIVETGGSAPRHVAHGCITTSAELTLPERLLRIHDAIVELLERHAPDLVAVERIYFQRNAQTAIAVGHARGVILLAAAERGLPVVETTPNEVKQAVTGSGAADKRQVQRMVRVVLGLDADPRPDDAADALAVAIWASNAAAYGTRDGRRGAPPRPCRDRPGRCGPLGLRAGRARRPARGARRGRREGESAMIASLDGTVGAVSADSLVVEVGGVGYRVFCAPSLLASAVPGARMKVHTFHLVREDQQALYGFASAGELGFFTLLLTVQGVGPKVALAIVGSRPIGDLQLAIVQDDQAVLVSVPGVGKRLAGRICLELKEKVEAAGIAAAGTAGPSGGAGRGAGDRGGRRPAGARLQRGGGPSGRAARRPQGGRWRDRSRTA